MSGLLIRRDLGSLIGNRMVGDYSLLFVVRLALMTSCFRSFFTFVIWWCGRASAAVVSTVSPIAVFVVVYISSTLIDFVDG